MRFAACARTTNYIDIIAPEHRPFSTTSTGWSSRRLPPPRIMDGGLAGARRRLVGAQAIGSLSHWGHRMRANRIAGRAAVLGRFGVRLLCFPLSFAYRLLWTTVFGPLCSICQLYSPARFRQDARALRDSLGNIGGRGMPVHADNGVLVNPSEGGHSVRRDRTGVGWSPPAWIAFALGLVLSPLIATVVASFKWVEVQITGPFTSAVEWFSERAFRRRLANERGHQEEPLGWGNPDSPFAVGVRVGFATLAVILKVLWVVFTVAFLHLAAGMSVRAVIVVTGVAIEAVLLTSLVRTVRADMKAAHNYPKREQQAEHQSGEDKRGAQPGATSVPPFRRLATKALKRPDILIVVFSLFGMMVLIAGTAAFRGRSSPPANASPLTPGRSPNGPSPSFGSSGAVSGDTFITVQDPVNEFSISRPPTWVARALVSPDPNIAMTVGPDAPYPIADFVAVTIHRLPFPLANKDIGPFKDFVLQLMGSDLNIIGENPLPLIDGHAGYFFVWSYPKAAPTTLHEAYYLIDGDRFVSILLQIEPPTDSTSLANLSPVFQQMAQSFRSYHVTPTPTSTVTSTAKP